MPKPSKKKHPRPARMVSMPLLEVLQKNFGADAPEGSHLTCALSAAVPLWMLQFSQWTEEQRADELKRISDSDFCLRMQYLYHQGPKPGDTAKAFNDLAKSIALLSFCPGGVTVFGTRWDWQKVKVPHA